MGCPRLRRWSSQPLTGTERDKVMKQWARRSRIVPKTRQMGCQSAKGQMMPSAEQTAWPRSANPDVRPFSLGKKPHRTPVLVNSRQLSGEGHERRKNHPHCCHLTPSFPSGNVI